MAKMLFDGQVALDILAAQPDVDRIKGGQFAREHHELLALAAPRPFLLVGGNSADGVASWPYVSAALEV